MQHQVQGSVEVEQGKTRGLFPAPRRAYGFEGLLLLSLVVLVGIVGWTSPRGFDLLDSGCYFLEYAFPLDSADTHTSYRFFASPLYYAFGENIVAFRWLSWVLVWGAAAVFAWGWNRHLRALSQPDFAATRLLSGFGTLAIFLHASSAMYTIKPAALTYNSLNLVGVYVALGLFLAGVTHLGSGQPERLRMGIGQVAAAALVASIDFFIKPTTAAFLLGAFVVYLLLSPALSGAIKRRLCVIASVATMLGGLALMVLVGGWSPFVARFVTLLNILRNDSYMGVLLERTAREFRELAAFLASDLPLAGGLVLVATGVLWGFRRQPERQRVVAAGFGVGVVALWVYRLWEAKLWRGSHQLYFEGVVARFYLSAVVLAVAAALLSTWIRPALAVTSSHRGYLKVLIGSLLLLTPFAGAFGSTTSVYLNGALYAGCWLAVMHLALQSLASRWQATLVAPTVLVPLVGFSLAQLVHGQIVMPYMNPKPLWEQTEPTRFGMKGSLLSVDPALHTFIEDTRRILTEHGFKPGDDIFCFFNVPGLVYAVGGRSPVIPWYFGRIYVDDRVEEWHLRNAGEARRAKAWVITQADAPRFKESYERGGMNFPDGYERIGTLTNPVTMMEIGLWKPRRP